MIWKEKSWIPGVLSKEQLIEIIQDGFISVEEDLLSDALDYSSLDLHLSHEGYRMKEGSIKPCGGRYKSFYENSKLADRLTPDANNEFILAKTETYVFKLKERFSPSAKDSTIFAQATAKSSIGRLDVVARLIVDGMYAYEYMNPKHISSGEMFLEITPITFDIKVRENVALSQIRFFVDEPIKSIIPSSSISDIILIGDKYNDGTLGIDLENEKIEGKDVAAFKAKKNPDPIPVWEKGFLDPTAYWECISSKRMKGKSRFTIEPNEFYILRSKERLSLPKGVAVYCQAMDETLGEMRIHYAGFAHPFFGVDRKDGKEGTPLIFEIRGHNVKVNLTDGEKLARLVFYRMSEDCKKADKKTDGENQDEDETPEINRDYNEQELKLSTFFMDWSQSASSTNPIIEKQAK